MTHRIGPLSFAIVVLLAGCIGISGPATQQNSTDRSATYTPTETDQILTPRPLPSKPDTVRRNNVVSFVSEYEKAYIWNATLERYEDKNVDAITVKIQNSSIIDETEGGYVVHLDVWLGLTYGTTEADMPYEVNYRVNETAVQRSEVDVHY